MESLTRFLDTFLISETYIKILMVLISLVSVHGMTIIYESIKNKETE